MRVQMRNFLRTFCTSLQDSLKPDPVENVRALCISLVGGQTEPVKYLVKVYGNAIARDLHHSQSILTCSVAMFGVVNQRGRGVLRRSRNTEEE